MTTEYRVRLDRDACEGVFACLVRDDRFVEARDGLATVETSDGLATVETSDGLATVDGGRGGGDGSDVAAAGADESEVVASGADESAVVASGADGSDELLVSFADDRLADAKQAARACPVDAIDVLTESDDE